MRNRSAWVTRLVVVTVLAFVAVQFSACLPKNVDDLKNMKLGKYGQTVHVEKADLGKTVKTQWGNIKLSDSQVKTIKKLKKNKSKTISVSAGKNDLQVVVTYLGSKRYQLGIVKMP